MTGLAGRRLPVAGLAMAAALAAALWLSPAAAQEEGVIAGRVVNGTAGSEAPAGLDVILVILAADGTVETESAVTDSDGGFRFEGVSLDEGSEARLTVSYDGIMYASGLGPVSASRFAELVVYETTDSLEAVRVSGDVLLLRGSDDGGESLAAFEIVELLNEGDHTFVPDLDQPAQMKFLRFSLPEEAVDLDVSSDLAGGRLINVGSGFALTAPFPPGEGQVAYTYRLPYRDGEVRLSRTFPMGADLFRLLVERDTGSVGESAILSPIETAEVDGRSYNVSGAGGLEPGDRLTVDIRGLPGPSWVDRVGSGLTDSGNWKIAIPSAVGLVMAVLLAYSLRRRTARSAAAAGGAGSLAGLGESEQSLVDLAANDPERRALVREMASLDDSFHRGGLSEEEYGARRAELMAGVIRLGIGPGASWRGEAVR